VAGAGDADTAALVRPVWCAGRGSTMIMPSQCLYNHTVSRRPDHIPRSARRELSSARILGAARRQFSQHGYDQTTIRGVAAAAGVDPALVMRYFHSKEQLFREATATEPDEPVTGTPDDLVESLLGQLATKLDTEPVAALAMLRSMLTQRGAADEVRRTIAAGGSELSASIGAENPVVRASLIGSISTGVIVGRYILQLDGLREAPTEQVLELLRPCLRSLVLGASEPSG
jgi:AcrR family transcriptional regulator